MDLPITTGAKALLSPRSAGVDRSEGHYYIFDYYEACIGFALYNKGNTSRKIYHKTRSFKHYFDISRSIYKNCKRKYIYIYLCHILVYLYVIKIYLVGYCLLQVIRIE